MLPPGWLRPKDAFWKPVRATSPDTSMLHTACNNVRVAIRPRESIARLRASLGLLPVGVKSRARQQDQDSRARAQAANQQAHLLRHEAAAWDALEQFIGRGSVQNRRGSLGKLRHACGHPEIWR